MTEFDVFLSHNSEDKPAVRELARLLKNGGMRVWVDEEQLVPGRNWQPLLEEGIERSAAGAVLVGGDGLGPWENEEMQSLLGEAVRADKPVIPVLLPDAPSEPGLPLFLRSRTWVDLRPSFTDEGVNKLIWGITGKRPAGGEPAHEYAVDGDNPLAKILDHTDQLTPIRELLVNAAADRMIALVEACAEDWPSYLADHFYLDPWPDAPGNPTEATPLGGLSGLDDQEFWRALVKSVPHASEVADEEGRRARVRDWIIDADLRVLYLSVALEREGRRLPRIIRGVHATLAGLGELAPGTRVLVLISCLRNADKPPFWWPWYARIMLRRVEHCLRLHPLRLLEKPDVEKWYAGFPPALRPYYNCDQLRVKLLALFEPGCPGIRYEQARRRLVDEDALRRARLKP